MPKVIIGEEELEMMPDIESMSEEEAKALAAKYYEEKIAANKNATKHEQDALTLGEELIIAEGELELYKKAELDKFLMSFNNFSQRCGTEEDRLFFEMTAKRTVKFNGVYLSELLQG